MAIQVQLRRGTTAENDEFTGAPGELTYDTEKHNIRIHDGDTVGGIQVPTAGTSDYVIAWQNPTAENNYTWYRKYKSGWVEQGGRAGSATVTLPVEMSNNQYTAEYTQLYDYTGDWNNNFRVRQTNTTNIIVHPTGGMWLVCGMAA